MAVEKMLLGDHGEAIQVARRRGGAVEFSYLDICKLDEN